jgi:hypothetical protein
MLGERQQSSIGRGVDGLDRGGAGRDQSGIDLVVLGPLQVELGISAHLRRLKNDHDKSPAPELGDNGLLVAATRLDPDAFDAMPPQPNQQRLVTLRGVVDLQLLRAAIERDVELAFAGIDSSADRGTLGHLRRPSLVMRTLSSFNHPGPDEVPIAILLRKTALAASVGIDPIDRRPSLGGHPGWAIPHGTMSV